MGETKRKDRYLIAVGDCFVEQKAAEMQSGINVLGGSSVEHGKVGGVRVNPGVVRALGFGR